MKITKINELFLSLTEDADDIDKIMKNIKFPVDENNFGDENFLSLYACSKQYNVLKKVCSNIIIKLKKSSIPLKKILIEQFEMLNSTLPSYNFKTLTICPEAEALKLKYIKYLKQEKTNLNSNTY